MLTAVRKHLGLQPLQHNLKNLLFTIHLWIEKENIQTDQRNSSKEERRNEQHRMNIKAEEEILSNTQQPDEEILSSCTMEFNSDQLIGHFQ